MQTRIPKTSKNHKASFEHILDKFKNKEGKIIDLTNNVISISKDQSVSQEKLKKIWKDISKEIKRHNWKYFDQFTFSLLNCERLDGKDLNTLKFDYRNNLNLVKSLTIKLGKFDNITKEGIRILMNRISRKFKGLEKLCLVFSQCESITVAEMKEIISICTTRLPLKELSLGFYYLDITDKSVQLLGKEITRKLYNLRKLDLTFFKCNSITNEALSLFQRGNHIKLRKLNNISLNFRMCPSLDNNGLGVLMTDIIRIFENLEDIKLNFSGCENITDEGLAVLTSQIRTNFYLLNNLSLNFDECPIGDAGLKALAEIFKNKIRQINLEFGSTKNITDDGVGEMISSIQDDLIQLKSFSLKLEGCLSLTNKGLDKLSSSIGNKLKSLQNLHLDFTASDKIAKAEGLEALGSHLSKNLTNLQRLHLNFTFCDEINDQGIKKLGSSLLTIKSLEELDLNFFECTSVTNEGTKLFNSEIESTLPSLKNLSLNLSRCNDISDEGAHNLASSIPQRFPNLEQLVLGLSTYERVSGKGLKAFGKHFGDQSLKKLKDFKLDIDYCHKVNEEDKDNLCKDLKKQSHEIFKSISLINF